jgi:hypothetical protein
MTKEEISKLLKILIKKFENEPKNMKNCECIHFACENCNKIEKFTEHIYHEEAWIRDCPEMGEKYQCKFCSF